jgi:preprotein translocase subunit SecB
MSNQPQLQFKSFDVTKVILDREIDFRDGSFKVDIQHITEINDADKNKFRSVFIITITVDNNPFNFQVQALGEFEVIGENMEQMIYDNFLNISAPSIIYPYIRAFISNMVLQSGMKPIVIPPVYFGAQPKPEELEKAKPDESHQ